MEGECKKVVIRDRKSHESGVLATNNETLAYMLITMVVGRFGINAEECGSVELQDAEGKPYFTCRKSGKKIRISSADGAYKATEKEYLEAIDITMDYFSKGVEYGRRNNEDD